MAEESVGRRRRTLVGVVIALAALAAITYLVEGPAEMNDLEVFHRAGGRFLRGEALYRAEDGHFAFKYLPVAAAFFAPLSRLPLETAKVVWLCVLWLALSLAFVLSARLVHEPLPRWALPVVLVVLARSLEREYANGQINGLLLLLVIAALVLLDRRHERLAGALLAAAALLKLPWLLFLPYLLLARRPRAAAAFVAVFAAGLVLPALRYGADATLALHRDLRTLLGESTAHLLVYPTNVSLPGAIAKLTGLAFPAAAALAVLVLTVPCLALARRVWTERAASGPALALVTPLAILLSPQAWDYTILGTLPGLLLAATAAPRDSRAAQVTTVVVAVLIALDAVILFGRGDTYAAVMRASPGTWLLLWLLRGCFAQRGGRLAESRCAAAGGPE